MVRQVTIPSGNANVGMLGGIFSFLSFVASAFFAGFWVFGGSLGSIPLAAAFAFCLALAFVLSRLGL